MTNAAYTVSTAWTVVNTKTGDIHSGQDEDYFATISECKSFVAGVVGEGGGQQVVAKTLDGDGTLVTEYSEATPHIITTRLLYIVR